MREWDKYLAQADKRREKIRALYVNGMSIEKLAAKFHVSKPRIHQIVGKSKPRKR